MKKKNMINLCRNINKIKYAMVDRWSIIDDYDLLQELVEIKLTAIPLALDDGFQCSQ